jgi:hypothetical protein
MASESGSSPSGASTMMERADSWLPMRRSVTSTGEPVRQMTRVPRRSPARSRISSSISTLSRGARITTAARLRLSFAIASSPRIVITASDQPRISVWSVSSTRERPRRSSISRVSSAVEITPMSALTTNSPATVSSSIHSRNRHEPESPATVPGSSACMRLLKSCWRTPGRSPSVAGASPVASTTTEKTTMRTSVATASQPTSADAPRDMLLSNA